MAMQGAGDRLKRLTEGRCPIHGISMPQVGNDVLEGRPVYIVRCPRRDCGVMASRLDGNSEASLLPRYAHLLLPLAG